MVSQKDCYRIAGAGRINPKGLLCEMSTGTDVHTISRSSDRNSGYDLGYALPGPSIVEIYDTFEPDSIQLSKQVQLPVFSLLQTCRDSRAIATKLYECYAHPNGKILLNIESDILYCNSAVSAKELLLNAKTRAPHPKIVADRGKLKYVALNLREVKYFLLDDTGTYDFLALKSLEKVLVVIPRNNTWRREEKVPVAHRGIKLLFKPYVPRARVLPPNTLYVWPNDDIEQVIRWWELKFGSKNESNSMAHVSLEFVTVKRNNAPQLLSDMIYEFWKEEKALRPNQEGTLERSLDAPYSFASFF
ncbi:hypothetical protein B0J14DRAFT_706496 [Halenospora varia]|nr:hypothetical protein B0J14DRAFT_706496 [Halenospora varia]